WAFFFSSRRRHTSFSRDWSSDVCSSDLCLGLERGSVRTKKRGDNPPLATASSATRPGAGAQHRLCALAARTGREATSARRTARTLQGDLPGRGTSPTGCVCPWRRHPAFGPEPTEFSGRGSPWPAPPLYAAL